MPVRLHILHRHKRMLVRLHTLHRHKRMIVRLHILHRHKRMLVHQPIQHQPSRITAPQHTQLQHNHILAYRPIQHLRKHTVVHRRTQPRHRRMKVHQRRLTTVQCLQRLQRHIQAHWHILLQRTQIAANLSTLDQSKAIRVVQLAPYRQKQNLRLPQTVLQGHIQLLRTANPPSQAHCRDQMPILLDPVNLDSPPKSSPLTHLLRSRVRMEYQAAAVHCPLQGRRA